MRAGRRSASRWASPRWSPRAPSTTASTRPPRGRQPARRPRRLLVVNGQTGVPADLRRPPQGRRNVPGLGDVQPLVMGRAVLVDARRPVRPAARRPTGRQGLGCRRGEDLARRQPAGACRSIGRPIDDRPASPAAVRLPANTPVAGRRRSWPSALEGRRRTARDAFPAAPRGRRRPEDASAVGVGPPRQGRPRSWRTRPSSCDVATPRPPSSTRSGRTTSRRSTSSWRRAPTASRCARRCSSSSRTPSEPGQVQTVEANEEMTSDVTAGLELGFAVGGYLRPGGRPVPGLQRPVGQRGGAAARHRHPALGRGDARPDRRAVRRRGAAAGAGRLAAGPAAGLRPGLAGAGADAAGAQRGLRQAAGDDGFRLRAGDAAGAGGRHGDGRAGLAGAGPAGGRRAAGRRRAPRAADDPAALLRSCKSAPPSSWLLSASAAARAAATYLPPRMGVVRPAIVCSWWRCLVAMPLLAGAGRPAGAAVLPLLPRPGGPAGGRQPGPQSRPHRPGHRRPGRHRRPAGADGRLHPQHRARHQRLARRQHRRRPVRHGRQRHQQGRLLPADGRKRRRRADAGPGRIRPSKASTPCCRFASTTSPTTTSSFTCSPSTSTPCRRGERPVAGPQPAPLPALPRSRAPAWCRRTSPPCTTSRVGDTSPSPAGRRRRSTWKSSARSSITPGTAARSWWTAPGSRRSSPTTRWTCSTSTCEPGADARQVPDGADAKPAAGRANRRCSWSGATSCATPINDQLERIYDLAYAQEVVVGLVALLGVVSALFISVLQRRRELGLLRAVGASQGKCCGRCWRRRC